METCNFHGFFAKYVRNDNSNLQTQFGQHITSNISKMTTFKIMGLH